MLIGLIGLGMVLGTLTGAAALITGHSFLMALGLYASVGTLSTLMVALILFALSGVQSGTGEATEGPSLQ